MAAKKKKTVKYPEEIYARIFSDGEVDTASNNAEDFDDGETVGVYTLVKVGKLKKLVEVN